MSFITFGLFSNTVAIQAAIISAITSIFIFCLGLIFKIWYEKHSLKYKMKKEYNFEQRKKIKEILASTKTPLIKSAEELNDRLWNLSENIDKGWHNLQEYEWPNEDKYYLRSFTYRFLSFIYWIIKAENSIYSLDFTQADKADSIYLKYVKTLKHFFCECELLEELGYSSNQNLNHFYKDELCKYISFIEEDGTLIEFEKFEKKYNQDSTQIKKVIIYITNIKNQKRNLNYNIIKSFHLFLMLFLNKYGLDYHQTSNSKLKDLMNGKYSDLAIKKGLYSFLERNKVLKESKTIIKTMKLKE